MSEYHFVEKPFLTQLEVPAWEVIDLGEGIPKDPVTSQHMDFREVVLKDIFKHSVSKLNLTDTGQPWLNDKQLDDLFDELTNQTGKTLLEASMDVLQQTQKSHRCILGVGR